MPLQTLTERLEETYGGLPVLVMANGGRAISASEIAAMVRAIAGRLRAAGLVPGDCLLISGQPRLDLLVLIWAAWAEGLMVALVDTEMPPDRYAALCHRLRPALVLAGDDLGTLPDAPPAGHALPTDPTAPALILHSSGSTGEPKGIMMSAAALAGSGHTMATAMGWRKGDRLLNLMGLHGMSGLRNIAVAAPLAGVTVVLPESEPAQWLFEAARCCNSDGVTLIATTPALLERLMKFSSHLDVNAFANVRLIMTTGAPLRHETALAVEARFGPRVRPYYGLTETGGICVAAPPWLPLPGSSVIGRSCGPPLEVRDENGSPLPDGRPGELWVGGSNLCLGYFDDPGRTGVMLQGGWFRTGDQVVREPDGWIRLLGRRDARIKTSQGEIVWPAVVEAVLQEDSEVLEAAACAYEDSVTGDTRLAAFLVPASPPADGEAFLAGIRQRLMGRLDRQSMPARFLLVESVRAPGQIKPDYTGLKRLLGHSSQ